MPSQKKYGALLVKTVSSERREYRRLKELRKGPMSEKGLKMMIMKFEETKKLG